MDNAKLISDLCGIIDAQNAIILAQAMEIAQLSAVVAEEALVA